MLPQSAYLVNVSEAYLDVGMEEQTNSVGAIDKINIVWRSWFGGGWSGWRCMCCSGMGGG